MEFGAFLKHKVGVECHIFATHLSNAGQYPSQQEAWEAKLQDHIGKQSSLADEAKSYRHFEVPPVESRIRVKPCWNGYNYFWTILYEHVPVLEILCHPILSPFSTRPTNPEPQDPERPGWC